MIIDAWNYSQITGKLSNSNIESVITLLPKQGKDSSDIKNWRPITLSNCDSKIITKAISIRISQVLSPIIDRSQTAYVPSRSVMDNIRSNFILKNHCKSKKINAVLISLDAKKAFDSVSHEYIRKVLVNYGFGNGFIRYFDVLYKDITSTIMINGYKSTCINIKRGVKQGDALSCALFILCIDPLLRNISNNNKIEGVSISSGTQFPSLKVSGYADDIAIICKSNHQSINEVFKEYERLTKASGLELNADKTEILHLNPARNDLNDSFFVSYMEKIYEITPVSNLKICGLNYSNDSNVEYNNNIIDKIDKLECNLKKWMVRNLTLEGKILIVKTFGLSQIIYNLQCYQISQVDLVRIERLIFKFIWSKKWKDQRPIERIRRSVLKNNVDDGGLNAPDVECLNRALKLKQFIRSNKSDHPIADLQRNLLKNIKYEQVLNQEYCRFVEDEPIIGCSQATINRLTDHDRNKLYGGLDSALTSKIAIDLVSSIKIEEYLKRKNQPFIYCQYRPLQQLSILNLHEMLLEKETSHNRQNNIRITNTLSVFNNEILQIAEQYNEDLNDDNLEDIYFLDSNMELRNADSLSVKDLQKILKLSYGKVNILDVTKRNSLISFDFNMSCISKFRKQCKDTRSRSIFYRLINNDFFNAAKMFKFGMTDSPNCTRCNEVESSKHHLFNCHYSRSMWSLYNDIIKTEFKSSYSINRFEDIFDFNIGIRENRLKIKLIIELIQIERPTFWSRNKIMSIIAEMKSIDKYIWTKNNLKLEEYNKKWK
jgi:hypothetical protein